MGAVSKIDVHRESSLGWIDFLSDRVCAVFYGIFPYVIAQIDVLNVGTIRNVVLLTRREKININTLKMSDLELYFSLFKFRSWKSKLKSI